MNYLKSIFQKKSNQNIIDQRVTDNLTIYDNNSLTVNLNDIKAIIKSEQKRKELYFRPTKSLLEQLKVLYTIHMMIISEQISDEDQLIDCFSKGKRIIYKKYSNQRCIQSSFVNKTNWEQPNDNSKNVYQNNSEFPIVFQSEEVEFSQQYYSYLQRAANNCDIYYSSQKQQYPYVQEQQNRKTKFLWLFKLINLINFKLSMIPMIQKIIFQESEYTEITKEIAILVYKDCINEYVFLKKEIEEQMEQYQQINVKDIISLFELYIQTKQLTNSLKLFHNMRQNFLKYEKIDNFSWIKIDKQEEQQIELYVQRIKLINSSQFKNSLKVPSQKQVIDNLQQKLMKPQQKQVILIHKKENKCVQIMSPKVDKKKQQSKQNSHRIMLEC